MYYPGLTTFVCRLRFVGYLKADKNNRLQVVTKKAKWYSYLLCSISTLDELTEDFDPKLFYFLRHDPNRVLQKYWSVVTTFVGVYTT